MNEQYSLKLNTGRSESKKMINKDIDIETSEQWECKGFISTFNISREYVIIALKYTDVPVITLWAHGSPIVSTIPPAIELKGHSSDILSIQSFSDGNGFDKMICSASLDSTIIWYIENGVCTSNRTLQYNPNAETNYISFDSSGSLVALSQENVIHVIQISNGEVFLQLLGHSAKVTCGRFHPIQPFKYVSISEDRTFILWNLAEGRKLYQSAILSSSPLHAIAFSPITGDIFVGSLDGILRVFKDEDTKYIEISHFNIRKLIESEDTQEISSHLNLNSLSIESRNDLPSWANKSSNQEIIDTTEAEHDNNNCEIACPILQIESFDPSVPSNSSSMIVSNAHWIIIGTSKGIVQLNSNSYRIEVLHHFSKRLPNCVDNSSIPSKWNRIQEKYVQIASQIKFLSNPSKNTIFGGVCSSFDAKFTLLRIKKNISNNTNDDVPESNTTNQENIISVIPSSNPIQSSILNSLQIQKTPEKKNKKESISKKNLIKKSMDKPVTFHNRIRSSGYGNSTLNNTKSTTKTRTKFSMASPRSDYPIECDIIQYYQEKHRLSEEILSKQSINQISFSKNGQYLATVSSNGNAYAFRLPIAKHQGGGNVFVGHNSSVHHCDWNWDNDKLLTSSHDGTACMWSLQKDHPVMTFDHLPSKSGPKSKSRNVTNALFYYMDRLVLLSASNEIGLYTYYIDSVNDKDLNRFQVHHKKKLLSQYQFPETQTITSILCVNDFQSHLILVAGSNRSLWIYDTGAESIVRKMTNVHEKPIHTLCFPTYSPYVSFPASTYDLFLSAAADNAVHLWDLRSNTHAMRFGEHSNRIHDIGIAFSPCMRYVCTGSENKLAYLYDLRTGRSLVKLQGHNDVVSSVSFHPIYPQIATASFNGNIRFYADKI